MKSITERFTVYDIIIIAMMAALGIAIKAVVQPLVQIITGPLAIPGGTIAGGIYMMFIVLGYAIVRKKYTAFLICLVQAIMVMATGWFGTHGITSIVTYTLPGIGVELLFFITHLKGKKNRPLSMGECFAGGIVANVIGSTMVNFVFFDLAFVPLMLMLFTSALSGSLGGLLAYSLSNQINKVRKGEVDDDDEYIDISKQDERQ